MLDELGRLEGKAFDTAYVRQQRLAHDEALTLHLDYVKNGDTRELREAAKSALSIIRRHIGQLRSLPREPISVVTLLGRARHAVVCVVRASTHLICASRSSNDVSDGGAS